MKNLGSLGCYWFVGLWTALSTATIRAEEAAPPQAGGRVVESPPLCRCEGDLGSSVARIREVLSEPLKSTGLEFTEEPLENVVNFLQDEYSLPIQIDEVALEDAGMTRDEPLSIQIRNVSLQSALRLMLKTKQLTYVIRDEVMIITIPEVAESELIACVYDVRDLIGRNPGNKNLTALVDTVSSCVAHETWAINGKGAAEIKALQPGLLVIAQTQAVHEEIGKLLALILETARHPNPRITIGEGEIMGGRGGGGGGYGGRVGNGMEGGYGGEGGGGGYGGAPGGEGGRGGYGLEGGYGGERGGGGYGGDPGGRGGEGGRGGYGGSPEGEDGERGMGREPQPKPAKSDDLFGP